jgi:hypothetical protein
MRNRFATPSISEIFATLAKSFHAVTLQMGFSARLLRTYNESAAGMPGEYFIYDPAHWRTRADEARILAKELVDLESRDAILRDG